MTVQREAAWRAMFARRVFVGAGLLAVFLSLVLTAYGVVTIRTSQVTNSRTINNSQDTLDRVVDCTTVGHKCFDQNQRRSARLVGSLNQVTIAASAAAAACAARPDVSGYEQIKVCVESTLAEQNRRRK